MNGRTNSTSASDVGVIDIPLDPPTSFICEARNSKVDITWVDPKDKYATPEGEQMEDTDQLVSVWSYTKIVRKEGSQPSSPSDGITVYTSDIRNQHQSTIYEDTGVTNGVTYYYAAYAYNTDGVYSDGAFSSGITPIEWRTVLNENSWEQIDSACTQGVAQSLWEIGDEKDDTLNSQPFTFVILAFNHNTLVSGGKAAITFGSKNTIVTTIDAFPPSSWIDSVFATYIMNTIPSQLSDNLNNVVLDTIAYYGYRLWEKFDSIDEVSITYYQYNSKFFGINRKEICGSEYPSGGGQNQYPYFTIISNRIKNTAYSIADTICGNEISIGHPYTYLLQVSTRGEIQSVRGMEGQIFTGDNRNTIFGFCVGKSAV